MTTTPETETYLQLGIAALKADKRDEARELLTQAIEQDESNEQAWLWLSAAVNTTEDKQICLENVLALNPGNESAKLGLSKLSDPISTKDHQVIKPEFIQKSSYDDIWERDEEICAFCAQALAGDEKECPRCGHQINRHTYRYPNPDISLTILWVMLLATAQLYLLQAIYNILVTRNIPTIILPIFLMGIFLILTAGIYLRQYWAYMSAIILLITILVINIGGMFLPATLSPAAMVRISPLVDDVVNPTINLVGSALWGFRLLAIGVALVVAVFKAGPDFERVETRHIAKLKKGLQSPSSYHGAAQRAAKRGEWATAVLHWQRAAAKAPGNRQFQRQLGIAYARLGFYQRSADVLQSALRITPDPEQHAQLTRLLTTVQNHLNTDND